MSPALIISPPDEGKFEKLWTSQGNAWTSQAKQICNQGNNGAAIVVDVSEG
jgi:hypothetical protein